MNRSARHSMSRRWAAAVACIWVPLLIAVAFPARMLWIITTQGINVILGFDYLGTDYVPLVTGIRDGSYAWTHFISDSTVFGTHVVAAPMLVRVALALATDWNMYAELYAGFAFQTCAVVLLWRAFTHGDRSRSRWVLLALMSGVVFSAVNVNTYTWGELALNLGVSTFGFALALHAATAMESTRLRVPLVIMGCSIMSLSGGVGLLVWPAIALVLYLRGYRNRRGWAAFSAFMVASALLVLTHLHPGSHPSEDVVTLGGALKLVLPAMGWSLTTAFTNATASVPGAAGLGLLIAAIIGFLRADSATRRRAVTPGALLGFGLATMLAIIIARSRLAAWYPGSLGLFWLGLLGTIQVLWSGQRHVDQPNATSIRRTMYMSVVGAACVLAVSTALGASNLSFRDKAVYLKLRSPVAASCLRNFHTRLDACWLAMGLPTVWLEDKPDRIVSLSARMEHSGMSVFGSRQTWWLQGEYHQPWVDVTARRPFTWAAPGSSSSTAYTDYRHLDLLMPAPGQLDWIVVVPDDARSVHLNGTVQAELLSSSDPASEHVTAHVTLTSNGRTHRLWKRRITTGRTPTDMSVDLAGHAGDTVTIHVSADDATAPRLRLRLGHPVVDLRRPARIRHAQPSIGEDLNRPGSTNDINLTVPDTNPTTAAFGQPVSVKIPDTEACASSLRGIATTYTASSDAFVRGRIKWILDSASPEHPDIVAYTPITFDGKPHQAVLDFKLQPFAPRFRFSSIVLQPNTSFPTKDPVFSPSSVRLLAHDVNLGQPC